jgi:FkbM family methyltransferase
MTTLGTEYGGWFLPENCLTEKSIVISAGVGEDISFDLLVQDKYDCEILLIDPTPRAIKHLEEVKDYYASKKPFTGSIQKDYLPILNQTTPDLSKLHLIPIGLWTKTDVLKFYKQSNPSYVSQSLIPNLYTDTYTEVPVTRLSFLLKERKIDTIDVLKLDIEGAELEVIDSLFEDNIFPKYLCVEFDLYLKGQDKTNRTKQTILRLFSAGYKLLNNKNYNMVFEKIR